MRIVNTASGMQEDTFYTIYDSEEDWQQSGLESFSTKLHETEEGQYFRFDNGVYAPLIRKSVVQHHEKASPLYTYVFPRFVHRQRGTKYRIPISYTLDKEQGLKTGNPRYSAKDKYFVSLLESGVDVDVAYTEAFKNKRYSSKLVKLEKLFDHPKFKESIRKEHVMGRMKSQLLTAGIDEAYLVSKMKETLEDPKASASLKQYLFETITKTLTKDEAMEASEQQGSSVVETLSLVVNG